MYSVQAPSRGVTDWYQEPRLRDVAVYYHFAISTFPVKIAIRSSAFILEYLLQLPIRLASAAICPKWGCYKIQADDHDLLVTSDNENDDILVYESEKYFDDEDADGTNHAEDADGTNHLDLKLVKRGITRLYKFRREYGKPGGIKIKRYFDVDLTVRSWKMEVMQVGGGKWELQKRIGIFYLLEATSNCLIRLSYFKLQLDNERRRLQAVTKDVLVKKLSTEMTEKDVLVTPMGAYEVDGNSTESSRISPSSKVSTRSLSTPRTSSSHKTRLEGDTESLLTFLGESESQLSTSKCSSFSKLSLLVDAACIPDVGNNGLKIVKDGVGGFFTWPKNQVVLDEEVTPPTTIQKISDYNSAPKLQSKCKNYVARETMQWQARTGKSHKSLNYSS
ncbi:hypothetical protein Tco_0474403 [Tanacetum coccineum]